MSSPQELPQQAANYLFISSNKEAKRVIDTKVQNGKRYYKVKWESSWEAEDSVGEYQDLVDQFWNFVKRVSSDDGAEDLQKKSALSEEDGQEESTIPNSEDETPSKGAITLSDCVKLQESGNFYRLTQVNKESDDERPIFIVQGNQPQMKRKKGNVHVIGLQHEPKQAKKQRTDDPSKGEDDRRFPCMVCGMAFRRNDIRRRHEITHSKEYRYFCAICGKGFIRRYVLVKHLTRDHNTNDSQKIVYQKNTKKEDDIIKMPSALESPTDQQQPQNALTEQLQQIDPELKSPGGAPHAMEQPQEEYRIVTAEEAMEEGEPEETTEVQVTMQAIVDDEGNPVATEDGEDGTPNIHVTAILASALEKSDDKDVIKVKEEITQSQSIKFQ
uniref:C2H2-type domain-containing protein n=1 Tax=Clytia hemisphaerica TaxID=252671 RepID=A0A7M5TS78_9CNID